ncbi:MAG: hypothetical protein RLZZ628_3725 [Bacteroidota bacterium]|jgi:mRNA-degrading endonuclease RelE of RelBE toxin-antitoxin system
MPYKIAYRSSFERDLKAFKKDKLMKQAIQSQLERLVEQPTMGKLLLGQWSGFYNVSFHQRPELRILYVLYPCCPLAVKEQSLCRFDDLQDIAPDTDACEGMIEFVFVKTREECNNLYAKDSKYTNNFKRE